MSEVPAAALALARQALQAQADLGLDETALAAHLARHPDALPAHAADLALAFACIKGLPKATEELDRRIRSGPLAAVARQLAGRVAAEEIHGRLLQRLLMAEGERPAKIAEYSGKGPLDGWLHAVAYRVALNVATPAAREVPLDEALLADGGPATGNAELDLLRERFRAQFRQAVRAAVASLSARDRTVLRLSVMEGLSIDELGRTFRVHRATVARWIAAAREQIVERTRQVLRDELKLQASELDSLMGVAGSQLDASLGRFLKDPERP
ncbi:MAG: sigma factor-like helix-turn-helix DNA-binding protein [Myxococcales bacterium]